MSISPAAARLRDLLRGRLLAAAATPMTAGGEVDLGVVRRYYASLLDDGADGLAVLAHTGRGPFLGERLRGELIELAVSFGVPVVVGVGGTEGTAERQARAAAELGASGVMLFPSPDDRLAEHDEVWRATGLPMIAFDLYTSPCPPAVLDKLVHHPGVAGLKVALLSDAMACQDAIAVTRAAGRLAITGEDRMFGPSLLWGAQAALVGLAAARVGVTAAVMRAFRGDDLRAFEAASAELDRLAGQTFVEPMEGYVRRMLALAAQEGRIPAGHAYDPHRPA